MSVSQAYSYLFIGALIVIAICLIGVIIKSIIGPRISDRIVTINMVGTLVTSCIAILSVYLTNESYLIDVCIIYVLISFLSVIVLTNVFINQYLEKKKKDKKEDK
jgi:multicomponent Na+:H+ antiporter subunit F